MSCEACGLWRNVDEPDPCWGELPGVEYACCGHGVEGAYISFDNGVSVYFDGPLKSISECGVTPPSVSQPVARAVQTRLGRATAS